MVVQKCDYSVVVDKWDDAHRYSPAPRHRRRMIMRMIENLDFGSYLDVGCAQPFLIEEMLRSKRIHVAGCDISEKVIQSNKERFPLADFFTADISVPQVCDKKYDLVTCSEVLEHIEDWQAAVSNIASWSSKWLLITVPSGRVYPIDQHVGHIRHFEGDELVGELKKSGFYPIQVRKWGFPFHVAYKYFINGTFHKEIYKNFAESNYGFGQRIVSDFIYGLFFFNYPFNHGSQFIALFKRK